MNHALATSPATRRRTFSLLSAAALALAGLASVAAPAGATVDLLQPTGTAQNVPDSGACGSDGGRWVKFTTGGTVTSSGTANSGNPKWTAEYTSSPGAFEVHDVVDQFGNLVYFEALVGGSAGANPVWQFDLTNDSPGLAVTNDDNFSQFAICALPPLVTATITKTVTGDADPLQSFSVHVECHLVAGDTNLAFPADLTLVAGESGDITAPAGAACTVTEPEADMPAGYDLVSITPNEFTMPTPSKDDPNPVVEVSVVNEVSEEPLTISKTAIGGSGTFTFDVSCEDSAGDVVFSEDGVQITIDTAGDTESTELTVPGRSTCTVTEVDIPDGFEVGDNPVVVSAGATASFTNTGYGSLRITKTQVGGLAGTEFTISYDCGADGPADSVTLADGESETIEHILGGSTCTVTETAEGYTADITPSTTGIVAGETADVSVTNTRDTLPLTVSKTTWGGTGTFSFDISCDNDAGETFDDTVYITTLSEGAPVTTMVDVPTGLSCTVTEGSHPGWTVDDEEQDAVPGDTVTFTNTAYGSLTIAKVAHGAPTGATFTIGYDCTDGTSGSVDLGGGESLTIDDIVAGSSCSVTEGDQPLYDVQIETSPATIVAGQTVTVTVTNTRKTTSLTINKTTVGGTGTFTFDVSCSGGDESFTQNGVTITVSAAGDTESTSVTGIPTGLTCLVTEHVPTGWSADHTTSSATAGGSVSFTNTKLADVTMTKYYDTNHNGVRNSGEPGIAGWKFKIGSTVYTSGSNGSVTTQVPAGSTVTVTEGSASGWVHTTPVSASVSSPASATFGNVCINPGTGGNTIGFWRNKNGQALVNAEDLAALRALPLVNQNGTAFDPTTKAQLARWLQGATATNMAYMLSAQLSATTLSIRHGFLTGTEFIYAPGVTGSVLGFVQLSALVTQATNRLAADGYTPSGDPHRAYQAVLEAALDGVNNRTNVLQAPGVCTTPTSFTW